MIASDSTAELIRVAVYRRPVRASVDCVWENALDWAHLPWLHDSAFSEVVCEGAGDWGWRARVSPKPPRPGRELLLELRVDRENNRYVTETLAGPRAGTQIRTSLYPVDGARTDIEVEFFAPGVKPGRAAEMGAAYMTLYAKLWDEDEAMMIHRTEQLAVRQARTRLPRRSGGQGPLTLGRFDAVVVKLPFTVEFGGGLFRVVESGGRLVAHSTVCPHSLGPLTDAKIENGQILCPWHGYRFDIGSGTCVTVPGLRLEAAPMVVVDPTSKEVRLEVRS
jgi:nitrite reductase/ring-hydroxylating ferredoxin subunit